jgi:hypothetical protein
MIKKIIRKFANYSRVIIIFANENTRPNEPTLNNEYAIHLFFHSPWTIETVISYEH